MLRPGVLAALALWSSVALGAPFQFEVLGATRDHVVLRENVPAGPEPDACSYPGLDPAAQGGVTVHFIALSDEAQRGRLFVPALKGDAMPLYTRGPAGPACTSTQEAQGRWHDIVERAKALGIALGDAAPAATVLGAAVAAKDCVLADRAASAQPCRRSHTVTLQGQPVHIAVSLTAVPEAPDTPHCQFIGHRFGVALQVTGLDFGRMESRTAPGGFADHYDCRSQQFEPLRLVRLDTVAVLLGGFRGTNIADRNEHPFMLVFPERLAP